MGIGGVELIMLIVFVGAVLTIVALAKRKD